MAAFRVPKLIYISGKIREGMTPEQAEAAYQRYVAIDQARDSAGGVLGISELSTGVPMLDNIASAGLTTGYQGGMTGYNAATGGDVGQGVMLDVGALGAGYGLAGAGLGTSTATAGGTTAAGGGSGAAASGGALMPAAVPESAATLSSWGLTEAAPGVWVAGGAGAVPAAAMPPAVPEAGFPQAGTPPPSVPPAPPPVPGWMDKVMSPQVLGMAGGALLGSGILGGGTEAQTTTTEEGLPDWLIPYARPALDRYTTELQNYQTDPYGVMPSAMKEFQNTISGMYLDPSTNKYLEDYFRLGSERIRTNLSPSFGHMQAFGQHSGYNEALSRGLGDFAVGLYGGNYAKERDRQTTMTASAPSFLGQASTAQFSPYQQYLNTVGNLGKKKQEPYYTNPMGNIIGGGMLGYGIGRAFT